ncbi:hypothetical protein SETIT_1G093700v2, partial [Setaria italica]|uniref:Uncharacterized protein n=1 Tax=Setaria italica TaxID=4555 RepID=K3YZV7_SETIT
PGIGGRNRSVYLAVCRRDWFSSKPYYPLYKVDVASLRLRRVIPCSQENPSRQAANRRRREDLRPLQSRWIVGVGGNPSGTVIYDTTKDRVIRGSELVAAKGRPVAATVGYRVYALSSLPNYIGDPDSVPWFEVLDLKDAVITEAAADGSLSLDGCSWERLPSPLCFPGKLTPMVYIRPPIITVRSYVVVGRYMLVSLDPPSSGTYAFDTQEHEWQKLHKEHLPFVGSATPHGRSGCVFLGLSRENGPVSAYRIFVSSASSSPSSSVSAEAGVCQKGGALKLSINVISVKGKEHEEVDANRAYDETVDPLVPRKLFAKLVTYRIENPEILEEALDEEKLRAVMPEVAISSQLEQSFKISSDIGFSSPPITFALSI